MAPLSKLNLLVHEFQYGKWRVICRGSLKFYLSTIFYKTKSAFSMLPDIQENAKTNWIISQANIIIDICVKLMIFEYVIEIFPITIT